MRSLLLSYLGLVAGAWAFIWLFSFDVDLANGLSAWLAGVIAAVFVLAFSAVNGVVAWDRFFTRIDQ